MLVCALGCKGNSSPDAAPRPPADAAPAASTAWVAACETALRDAPGLPPTRRVQAVIDGCRPCGDWAPILRWDVDSSDGGFTRQAVDAAMQGCKAFCDGNGRQRFFATFDESRGKQSRAPWRMLGEACKAAVSAVPDARFMSAPYFALDRIGRAAAAVPRLGLLLDGLELPLPPVTVSGSGFELSDSPATSPEAGPYVLTVAAADMHFGTLPRARLGKDGVTLVGAGPVYPGTPIKSKADLPNVFAAAGSNIGPIAVIAPSALKATALLDVVKAARSHELRLAVVASGAPRSWVLAGTVPVALVASHPAASGDRTTLSLGASPDAPMREAKAKGTRLGQVTIALAPGATIASLAKLLGVTAYFGVKTVALAPGR